MLTKSIFPQGGETIQLLRIDVTHELEEMVDEIVDNTKRSLVQTRTPKH